MSTTHTPTDQKQQRQRKRLRYPDIKPFEAVVIARQECRVNKPMWTKQARKVLRGAFIFRATRADAATDAQQIHAARRQSSSPSGPPEPSPWTRSNRSGTTIPTARRWVRRCVLVADGRSFCEVNDVWYRTRSPNRLERIWLWVEFGDGAFWLRWIACVFITLLVIVPRYLWWLCVGRWVEKRETTR